MKYFCLTTIRYVPGRIKMMQISSETFRHLGDSIECIPIITGTGGDMERTNQTADRQISKKSSPSTL